MWVAVAETPVLVEPSPQWTVMPEPTSGMETVWLAASVFQVVTNGIWPGVCCAWAGSARAADASAANRTAYAAARMVQTSTPWRYKQSC